MNPPRRMVVVDDDSKVRLLLERAFRAPEFETRSFPTGAAALAEVAAIRPDCVVSDILMPDMDGESLLRAMRTVPGLERVPFIAVSAVRSEARIRAVLAAGADAFLLKPFPLRDLLEKVRLLLQRPARRPERDRTSDYTLPTRPVVAVPHTMSTAAVRRKPAAAVPAPTPPAPPPPAPAPPPAAAPASLTSVRVSPVRVVVTAPMTPAPPARGTEDVHRVEFRPLDPDLGFGRFTRVQARGRSFVVLTEAAAQPKFTVTTVITEKGVPLRRIESALPHPLAREEDGDLVRRQLDLQHDNTLRRLDDLVLDNTPRRVVWSDQSRSVDVAVLAWTMSAVAQLAEAETGTDETIRQLRLTHEKALLEEGALRAFRITPAGRVVVGPGEGGRVPRRTVRAVAGWCRAFAIATLQSEIERIGEPVRQATRRYALELDRMGFYDRLLRRAKA
ncbi:MAG TPA: response regulator [Vicinamibacteria bacterium]|nr:response regulator [Vicinamibacteria bacterium]